MFRLISVNILLKFLVIIILCLSQNKYGQTTSVKADSTKPSSSRRGTSPGELNAHLDYTPGKVPGFWSVATAQTVMARYPDYRTAYWKDWTYVQGYMFYGFEMLYDATGDKIYLDYIKRYIDNFV